MMGMSYYCDQCFSPISYLSRVKNKVYLTGRVFGVVFLPQELPFLQIIFFLFLSDYIKIFRVFIMSPVTNNIDDPLQDEEANN